MQHQGSVIPILHIMSIAKALLVFPQFHPSPPPNVVIVFFLSNYMDPRAKVVGNKAHDDYSSNLKEESTKQGFLGVTIWIAVGELGRMDRVCSGVCGIMDTGAGTQEQACAIHLKKRRGVQASADETVGSPLMFYKN